MKTVVVTGAAGNLGMAVVKKFLAEGYKVTGTITPRDTLTGELTADRFKAVTVDLSDEKQTHHFVESVIAQEGKIDAAVLTVGGFAMGEIADTSAADIFKQYQLNFETAYNVARPLFIQMMRQGYGRIFLVGSKPGLSAANGKGMTAYSLAKSLIFRLAELMNEEADGTNVVTTVIVPGTIDTPQNRASMPGADFSKWVQAGDIANAVFYYCSDEASPVREPVLKMYNRS